MNEIGESKFSIRKVNNNTFDIIPEHTYNNANYYLSGLGLATDTYGNPLYQFNWDMCSFSTPLNPAGGTKPTFVLDKSTYRPAESIIVKPNFTSKDLKTKLSEIKLYRETEVGECQTEIEICGFIEMTASVGSNQISIKPTEPMIAGRRYWLIMPILVDDNNNLVYDGDYEMNIVLPFVIN